MEELIYEMMREEAIKYGKIFLATFAIIIGIAVIAREIRTWYWKINERIENQEKIIELLKDMKQMQEYQRNFLKYICKENQETNDILKKIAESQEIKLDSKDEKQENS